MAEILHVTQQPIGKFILNENQKQIGKMEYKWLNENKFNIFHTEVDKEYGGKGLAEDLLNSAIDYARKNDKKITATCSYAKKKLDLDPEVADIYEKN